MVSASARGVDMTESMNAIVIPSRRRQYLFISGEGQFHLTTQDRGNQYQVKT